MPHVFATQKSPDLITHKGNEIGGFSCQLVDSLFHGINQFTPCLELHDLFGGDTRELIRLWIPPLTGGTLGDRIGAKPRQSDLISGFHRIRNGSKDTAHRPLGCGFTQCAFLGDLFN